MQIFVMVSFINFGTKESYEIEIFNLFYIDF